MRSRPASLPWSGAIATPQPAGDAHLLAIHPKGRRHLGDDALGQGGHLGEADRIDLDDGEFVRAETADDVVRPDRRAQPVGHAFDDGVAGFVTEGVVDILDPIEVDRMDRQQAVALVETGKRAAQPLGEMAAVGEAGQRVVIGEKLDMRIGLLLLAPAHEERQPGNAESEAGEEAELIVASRKVRWKAARFSVWSI